ncbi:MAG: N-acetyl-gamma-glutamyl-phosphate reductase [Alphaproteobacteria bacterium]
MASANSKVKIGILGASGYTGAELVRLLARHPAAELTALTADRQAGQPLGAVFPHLGHLKLPDLVRIEEADLGETDIVFCGLPHGTTQKVVSGLLEARPDQKVVDLSADFRLRSLDSFAEWYGHEHWAPTLQQEAVYGLTEVYRDAIGKARLVANPGCYTTTTELALLPLVRAGVISIEDIVIDAKSGVSGAGRAERQANLHTEVSEGVHAYSVGRHRHAAEIEQELSSAAGQPVTVSFTPHLIPMNRGILATCYVRLANGAGVEDLRSCLKGCYDDEPFVHVAAEGVSPSTRHVRGSNHCIVAVFPDRLPGRAIVLSVTDNLVKGASGQAIQNMNVMLGLPETTGLEQEALFP